MSDTTKKNEEILNQPVEQNEKAEKIEKTEKVTLWEDETLKESEEPKTEQQESVTLWEEDSDEVTESEIVKPEPVSAEDTEAQIEETAEVTERAEIIENSEDNGEEKDTENSVDAVEESEQGIEEVKESEQDVPDADEVKEEKKPFTKKRKIQTAVGAAAALLLIGYAGGSYYFSKHYFPHTTINGVDTSLQDNAEALESVKNHLADYELSIESAYEDGMTVTAEEAGLEYAQTEDVKNLLDNQNNMVWFSEIFKDHVYTAMETTVDEEKLSETVDALACMNPEEEVKSVRAKIVYSEDENAYVIQEATVGNQVVKDELLPAVEEAILAGESTLDMTTNEYYKQPKYTSASEKVIEAKEKVDKYMSASITLEDGERSYTIDAKDIHNFIKISNDYKVSIRESKVKAFVQDTIWDELNTTDNATIIDSPGSGTFYVADSSDAKVVRVRTESEQIIKDIKAGKTTSRTPEYMTDFLVSDYGHIVGDNYVEVSISDQHVWAVEDGEVVLSTDVVTGKVSDGHASPTGIYTIKWKTTNYTMRKYKVTVSYWMPYDTNEGIGFHDATWRGSFGGSIYYYNGSHGCINMPYSAARSLYYIVDKGWPVIVH